MGSKFLYASCTVRSRLRPCSCLPSFYIVVVCLFITRKRKQADSVWQIKSEELDFQEPPQVLARGTFGMVLLAEYRGTQMVVKQVLPPKEQFARSRRRGGKTGKHESAQAPAASPIGQANKAEDTKAERFAQRQKMRIFLSAGVDALERFGRFQSHSPLCAKD
jgi:hypothetical protein